MFLQTAIKFLLVLNVNHLWQAKRLCFNCVVGHHGVNKCPSKFSCCVCRGRHQTSLCHQSKEPSLITKSSVVHPPVLIDVNGQRISCSPLGWSESLFSAVHVDFTQLRAVKNITRRVALNTNATGVRLVLVSD